MSRAAVAALALLALGAATARADELGRRRGVGMAMQDEYIRIRPGQDGMVGLGIALHLGRYWRALQWRGELAGAVASPGGPAQHAQLLRAGGAVRWAALATAIRSIRTLGMTANLDLGAGYLWYGDAMGPIGRPYVGVGLFGAMIMQDPRAAGPDPALSFALGTRLTLVEGGWTMTGGLEIEWGR